jgi:hypothetical protein
LENNRSRRFSVASFYMMDGTVRRSALAISSLETPARYMRLSVVVSWSDQRLAILAVRIMPIAYPDSAGHYIAIFSDEQRPTPCSHGQLRH